MVDYNENIRQSIVNNRFQLWRDFLANLERTAEPEHSVVRFPYSSTYIFSTGSSCFWMVDPGYTYVNAPQEELEELAKLIREKISFILVTHLHVDHCQPEWVKALAGSSVEWVVSERFTADFFKGCGGSPANTLLLADDETIELNGIKITARAGYHGEPGKPTVTSCAYDVELPDGIKLFFPADVRDPQQSVPEGKVDYTFGHVFLGREDATGNDFPHLEAVSRFLAKRPSGHPAKGFKRISGKFIRSAAHAEAETHMGFRHVTCEYKNISAVISFACQQQKIGHKDGISKTHDGTEQPIPGLLHQFDTACKSFSNGTAVRFPHCLCSVTFHNILKYLQHSITASRNFSQSPPSRKTSALNRSTKRSSALMKERNGSVSRAASEIMDLLTIFQQ